MIQLAYQTRRRSDRFALSDQMPWKCQLALPALSPLRLTILNISDFGAQILVQACERQPKANELLEGRLYFGENVFTQVSLRVAYTADGKAGIEFMDKQRWLGAMVRNYLQVKQ